MFNRSIGTAPQQPQQAAVASNGRRAFRDVTNASRTINEREKNAVVAAKRSTGGIKTRSMVRAPKEANSRKTFDTLNIMEEQRDADSSLRDIRKILPDPMSYQVTGNFDNIDVRDQNDPLCATEYVEGMYTIYREKEECCSVRPLYMEKQPHINERMRSILIDWLVEVHLKFKLIPETLYLTVNLIDRYLERMEVSRPKLQLVGVTCLLLASKYEEIYPPELRDLVYICDRAYTRQDIIEMEEKILKTLEYNITIPHAHVFLVRYLKAGHADKKIVQLSCYILDGTLQSYNLLQYLPSQLAAASVFIARKTVGRNGWSPTLLHYAAYCEEDIVPVARAILNEKSTVNTELRAVSKKYTSHRYGGVSSATLSIDL